MPLHRTRSLFIGLGCLLSGPALAGACGVDGITVALEAAFAAYADADLDAFVANRDAARRTLTCMDELLPGETAAQLHQLEALDAYLPPRTLDRSVQSFHAARMAWSAFAPSEALAPQGNLLREQWTLAQERVDDLVPLYPPRDHRLYLDGRSGTVRAVNRPVIAQLVDGDGQIVETLYLPPTALSPTWSLPETEPQEVVVPTGGTTSSAQVALPLAVSAAGAAIISGGLWALALSSRADLYDDFGRPSDGAIAERHQEGVESTQRTINTVGYAAQATAIVAGGLGAGALITWRW